MRNPYIRKILNQAQVNHLLDSEAYEKFVQNTLGYRTLSPGCIRYYYDKKENGIQNSIKIFSVDQSDHIPQASITSNSGEKWKLFYSPYVEKQDIKKHLLAGFRKRIKNKAEKHTYIFQEVNGKKRREVLSEDLAESLLAKSASIGCKIDGSQVLLFDIDSHSKFCSNDIDANERLFKIIQLMNYQHPTYIEKSKLNGGYHVYYIFQKTEKNDDLYTYYTELLQNNGIKNVDINHPNKKFILPLSATYQPIQLKIRKGDSYQENTSLKFIEIEDIVKLIEELSLCNTKLIFNRPVEIEIPEEAPHLSIFLRKKKVNTSENSVIFNRFPLYPRQRHHNHLKLAIVCYSRGMSYNFFKQKTQENNFGARDINTPQKLEKICLQLWQWCQQKISVDSEYFNSRNPEEWIPNQVEGFPIRKLTTVLLQRYKYSKNYKEYFRCTELILHQLIYQYLDNHYNPKEIRGEVELKNTIKKKLTECSTFIATDSLLKMKKKFNMKVDVHSLYNYIVESIFQIKEITPGKYYSAIPNRSWCRQYSLRRRSGFIFKSFEEQIKNWLYHIIKKLIIKIICNVNTEKKILYYDESDGIDDTFISFHNTCINTS